MATGKDYFGVSCEGRKRIVVALNRSVSTSYEMSLFLEGDEVRVDIHLVLTTEIKPSVGCGNEELQIFQKNGVDSCTSALILYIYSRIAV